MENNVRFGSTSSRSQRIATNKLQDIEFHDDPCNHSPNKLIQCPYDKYHEMKASKFPFHLVKCRQNHPQLAKELKTCPYNARHLVPEVELAYHMKACSSKTVAAEDVLAENETVTDKWFVPKGEYVVPQSEDWELEADEDAPPFVWGAKNLNPKRAKGNWNSCGSMRIPKSFPWSG